MKKILSRVISVLLVLALVLSFIPAFSTNVHAVTTNQQNIVDRANYFFDSTWVCQKTVYGWRDQYTFYEGQTYHLPYGQPVNSGKFIEYGVTLEDFLTAAADKDSVFYSRQSEYNGWTSVYYATDCSAFVAICWGTVRQDCSTIPYYSTYKGAANLSNILNVLQLGDALDSTSVGHVVLVTGMTYDNSGNLTQIEITEQTPPQLKRSYYTPSQLANKYGAYYSIYRYEGSVPAAPERGYTSKCTAYDSYCEIQITDDTPVMSLPCSAAVDADSSLIQTAAKGESYTATRLYENTAGELWYRIQFPDGEDGFVLASCAEYQKQLLDDITLTNATSPNGHVVGKTLAVTGNIQSKYNRLTTAAVYVIDGFGTDGTKVTGYSDSVTSNAYTLKNSTIDYNTSFGTIPTGNYTYSISANYKNYYATAEGTLGMNTGTVNLLDDYFVVIRQSVDQDSCTHSYTDTTIVKENCTTPGAVVHACGTCGYVYKETKDALGHSYSDWTVIDATCSTDGSRTRSCGTCDHVETEVISATGHSYSESFVGGTCLAYEHTEFICGNCGDSYNVFPDALMSEWLETKPEGVDNGLIETKKQYRYSDLETTTSYESVLDGYELLSDKWEESSADSIQYVKNWPAGFDSGNSLYAQYNKSPITASEIDNFKTTINSNKVTGYLYYHWCYENSVYSKESQSGNYKVFHAYYDTTNPSNYRCDTSDMSYCTAHSTCSNSEWYFVAEVNTQSYTNYQKLYTHSRWGDWSEWDDAVVEAGDSRKAEERTVYRYVTAELGDHNFVNGVCSVCGKESPVSAPVIMPKYPTLSFEDEILLNVFFTASDLGEVGLEDMGLITWETPHFDGTIDNAGTVTNGAIYDSEKGFYYVHTAGIPAKKLSDTVYFKIFIKLSDGSYVYSEMLSYSPKTYADSVLNGNYGTDMKALVVSMLNYGAAAQTYFGYRPYRLMNASLTAEQMALVDAYRSDMVSPVVNADSSKLGSFVSNGGFAKKYPTISFEGAFAINYFFTPNQTVDGELTLYYWDQAAYNGAKVLTAENASGSIAMTAGVEYEAIVAGIAAKDLDGTIYVAAVYESNGTTYCSGVLAYSIGAYCIDRIANGSENMQSFAAATAVYGYYAKAYFMK